MRTALFDLDGTLLSGNSSFLFCRFLRRKGVLSSSDLLYCTSLYVRHLFFGLSLWNLHVRSFERLFRGRAVALLAEYLPSFIQTLEWYEPALSRLKELRLGGDEIHIYSNSPFFLVKPIAEMIGVEYVRATDYEIDKRGRLWNIASLVDGEKKREMLLKIMNETIAFSDSHHDLPFLESATRAVAVNPTRCLSKIARTRSWEIL
ncbi:MAG: haloacid dehalogenase-like hydrolase [Chlamydiales bacterium]|nr:haloacid dehalogenase-like hydrolase [Chlamydiales bacterium]